MGRNVEVGSLIATSVLCFGFSLFMVWPLIHTINSVGTVALVADADINPNYTAPAEATSTQASSTQG